jgi:hypothetical protein
MAAIIYEKTPGALIATGNRSVTTFDSGLVRVDRTYVCASSSAATHRATLATGHELQDDSGEPAIDGLFIFPAPQEATNGDGFTEFTVSAYGRSKNELVMDSPQVVTTRGFADYLYYSTYIVTGTIVIRRGQSLDYEDLGLDPKYKDPFGYLPVNPLFSIVSVKPILTTATTRINWDGTISSVRVTHLEAKINNGVSDISNSIIYSTPSISVQNTRAFGEFIEMEIISTITSADAEIAEELLV